MEINIKIVTLLIGIVLTGLTAGLCFTWSNAVTPGIGRLDDFHFLRAFQAMNRAIINKTFILVFFGPLIFLSVSTYLFRNSPISFWFILIGTAFFFIGLVLITIFGNVPLNEILDKSNLEALNAVELQDLRTRFEKPWNQLHIIRTISATVSLVLLLIGLLNIK